jgi:hypothetical protein
VRVGVSPAVHGAVERRSELDFAQLLELLAELALDVHCHRLVVPGTLARGAHRRAGGSARFTEARHAIRGRTRYANVRLDEALAPPRSSRITTDGSAEPGRIAAARHGAPVAA